MTTPRDKVAEAHVQWASEISTRASALLDAPARASISARYRIKQGDLITPDGERVWRVAGWAKNGNLYCHTIKDFLERRESPAKCIPDEIRRYSRLAVVNQSPERIERFMADYMAAEHGVGLQEWRFGLSIEGGWGEYVGRKIFAYWCGLGSGEHVIQDNDDYNRELCVKDREGRLISVDQWEVTASWHFAWGGKSPVSDQSTKLRTVPIAATKGQFLYRLYTRAGTLLYVGITDSPFRRWKEHSRDKAWWGEVHKFTHDWYPDRASVEAAERHAIATETPLHNVIGMVK